MRGSAALDDLGARASQPGAAVVIVLGALAQPTPCTASSLGTSDWRRIVDGRRLRSRRAAERRPGLCVCRGPPPRLRSLPVKLEALPTVPAPPMQLPKDSVMAHTSGAAACISVHIRALEARAL